jgi:hypothetical protein
MTDTIFDHDRLDVYRLAIEYTAESFSVAKDLSGVHRPIHPAPDAASCFEGFLL